MVICNQPTAIQTECAAVYLTGLFIYGDHQAGDASIRAFMADFDAGCARFDLCIGSHRVRIVYPDGRELFFGDSAGVLFWFFDFASGCVFDRLSDVPAGRRRPNMAAIAQFLWFGCIYGMDTVMDGIVRSDPEQYYILQNGKITALEKGLTPLEQLPGEDDALALYMRRVLKAVGEQVRVGCSITAGTDSRTILSHLCANGVHPLLSITGLEDHVDVQIAREIASALDEDLIVVSGIPDSPSWISSMERENDGQAGICGAYRLMEQFKTLEEYGVSLQFGGVAGEFYKNSFINQDYPQYKGAPKWERFLKMKVITYDFPKTICGSELLPAVEQVPKTLLQMVSKHQGATKASAYLSAGYRILQDRAATLSMMENRHVVTCSPLLERCVVAPMLRTDPYQLEMQSYQRRQVKSFCPAIMDIPTDRGLTLNPDKMRKEQMKSALFLVKVAAGRIFRRKQVAGRIDVCFAEGLSSPQYRRALQKCKDMGIFAPEVQELPMAIADRVFALGAIF